jgi:hypothetical protein
LPEVSTSFMEGIWAGMTLPSRTQAELLLYVLTEVPGKAPEEASA